MSFPQIGLRREVGIDNRQGFCFFQDTCTEAQNVCLVMFYRHLGHFRARAQSGADPGVAVRPNAHSYSCSTDQHAARGPVFQNFGDEGIGSTGIVETFGRKSPDFGDGVAQVLEVISHLIPQSESRVVAADDDRHALPPRSAAIFRMRASELLIHSSSFSCGSLMFFAVASSRMANCTL